MQRAITWRARGTRSNGRICTITEVTEYDSCDPTSAPPRGSYVLVDHEPTQRVAKGKYQVLPSYELVTCDDPNAP